MVILEAEDAIRTHTSSRNSEVIHAGIYYPKGSLKATSCVAGKELLYEYCVGHGVPHRRCGKLIVATGDAQLPELKSIQAKAHANGVSDVVWLTREQAQALEPEIHCVAALYSPSTGIIDSHALMLAYLGDAEARGAMLALKSPLARAEVVDDGFVLSAGEEKVKTKILVNSAGLRAPTIAKAIEGYPAEKAPRELYAKGNYYSLNRRNPFSRLVAPGRDRLHNRRGGQLSPRPALRRHRAPDGERRGRGGTGRPCPTLRSRRAMPASGRRPRAPASRRPISRSRVRAATACRDSCTSSASSRPGSPLRLPWRVWCWRN